MGTAELLASGRVHDAVLDQLVRGAKPEAVLAILRRRFDEGEAQSILEAVQAEIADARSRGEFDQLEARIYSKPVRPRSALLNFVGWAMILLFGFFAVVDSLAFGQLSFAITPALIGALILVFNQRRRRPAGM